MLIEIWEKKTKNEVGDVMISDMMKSEEDAADIVKTRVANLK